jgi:aminoglycoside phosphotransferase (APT) family kinase protein
MGSTDRAQARLASADDKTSSSHTLTGRTWEDSMNQGTHPEELSAEVLADVASVVGAEVTVLSRLPGGLHVGAVRVQLGGRADAVLKVVPRAHPGHLDETLRAQRVVEHMRRRGYPTPAWLGVGATATHVWHLMDFVDAAAVPEFTPSIVEQLMEIIELQAGQACEPYDHWSYAWRVATGQESAVARLDFNETPEQSFLRQSIAKLSGYSSEVSALVELLRLLCADVPPPREAPDMVHADLNPSNVLVHDGAVVAVVDIGNAGSGTRATDLINLVWFTFQDPLDGVRRQLWTRILAVVGWEGAAVLAATHILHMLEFPIRQGRHEVVPGVVKRGHRALDELNALG